MGGGIGQNALNIDLLLLLIRSESVQQQGIQTLSAGCSKSLSSTPAKKMHFDLPSVERERQGGHHHSNFPADARRQRE